MSRAKPKGIVIDASIARAAGTDAATATRAVLCRDCLMAVRDAGLLVVLSQAIKSEWKTHRSEYARRWLTWMVGSRRFILVSPEPNPAVDTAIRSLLTETERAAAEKDQHLIEAAVAASQRVLSLDSTARDCFSKVAMSAGELRAIHWGNPESVGCNEWVADGTPDDSQWALA